MVQVVFLPHVELCPEGKTVQAEPGKSVLDVALDAGIIIEHACGKACACTTCHVVIVEGHEDLNEASELEEDVLDKAWGLECNSRLGCQVIVGDKDLVVKIPQYTVNQVSERHS